MGDRVQRRRLLWQIAPMATLRIRIAFASGALLGPGKAQLLEGIRDTGSIAAAARGMGMSYKRAWLLVDSMNQSFVEPVVRAETGGTRGGGAQLTEFGLEVLRRYRRMEADARAALWRDLEALEQATRARGDPKV
jgi:molybdate transport system regulatory protein